MSGAGGGENGELLTGTKFQFYKKKRVMRMDGGDGCTTKTMFTITELLKEIKIRW